MTYIIELSTHTKRRHANMDQPNTRYDINALVVGSIMHDVTTIRTIGRPSYSGPTNNLHQSPRPFRTFGIEFQ